MARQALKMPILASWHKVNKRHRSKTLESKIDSKNDLNGKRPALFLNGYARSSIIEVSNNSLDVPSNSLNGVDVMNVDRNIDQLPNQHNVQSTKVGPTDKTGDHQMKESTSFQINRDSHISNGAGGQSKMSASLKGNRTIEERITSLEMYVYSMQKDLDSKLSMLIHMLQKQQEDERSHFTKNNISKLENVKAASTAKESQNKSF